MGAQNFTLFIDRGLPVLIRHPPDDCFFGPMLRSCAEIDKVQDLVERLLGADYAAVIWLWPKNTGYKHSSRTSLCVPRSNTNMFSQWPVTA